MKHVSLRFDLIGGEGEHTHAGTAEGSGVSVWLDADTEDVNTGSVDVDLGAKVGEISTLIGSGINSTDSNGVGGRARRSKGSLTL